MVTNLCRFLENNIVIFERFFSCSIDRTWNAIATKEGLDNWFMSTPFEIQDGGRFSFVESWQGRVFVNDSEKVIQFNSDMADGTEFNKKFGGYLRFELEETVGGCKFKLIDKMSSTFDAEASFPSESIEEKYQPGGIGTHWSGILAGYQGFVDKLEQYLTGDKKSYSHKDYLEKYVQLLEGRFGSLNNMN